MTQNVAQNIFLIVKIGTWLFLRNESQIIQATYFKVVILNNHSSIENFPNLVALGWMLFKLLSATAAKLRRNFGRQVEAAASYVEIYRWRSKFPNRWSIHVVISLIFSPQNWRKFGQTLNELQHLCSKSNHNTALKEKKIYPKLSILTNMVIKKLTPLGVEFDP
jgi:hypothetical protein